MHLKILGVLALLTLISSVGCGQNPSVTGGDAGSGGNNSVAAKSTTPDPEAQQAGTNEAEEGAAKTSEPVVVAGMPGADGADGKDGAGGRDGVDANSESGSGDNGANGQDANGADGTNGENSGATGANGESAGAQDGVAHDGSNGAGDDGVDAVAQNGSDGKDGANGADGANGQDGKNAESVIREVTVIHGRDGIDGCAPDTIRQTPPIPAMAVSDLDAVTANDVLPLIDSEKHNRVIPKITLNENSPKDVNLSKIKRGKQKKGTKKDVVDSMVFFDIPVMLPPSKYVDIGTVQLSIITEKRNKDGYVGTEFLALLGDKPEDRILSGMRYTTNDYKDHNNPEFPNAVNELFSHIITDSVKRQGGSSKAQGYFDVLITITLEQLLQGSQYRSAQEYLYRNADPSQPLSTKLRFVIGDDTKVKNASLTIQYTEDTCARGLEKRVETEGESK